MQARGYYVFPENACFFKGQDLISCDKKNIFGNSSTRLSHDVMGMFLLIIRLLWH